MVNEQSDEPGSDKRPLVVTRFLFKILSYPIRCLFGLLIISFWMLGGLVILLCGTSFSVTSQGRKLARPFVLISEDFFKVQMGEEPVSDLIFVILGFFLALGMYGLYARFILPLHEGNIPERVIFWFLSVIAFLYFVVMGYSYQISFF